MRRLALLLTLAVVAAVPATAEAARCNGVPKQGCLLPFPNDYAQTKRDGRTPTGRRVALVRSELPANTSGKRIDPREWNRSDGFSPGQPITVHVPFIRSQAAFRRSGIVPVNDLGRYRGRRQPLLLLDQRSGRRRIVWGELDAGDASPRTRNLIIHPAKNLVPGRRYVVVLRNLGHRAPRGLWRTTSRPLRRALKKAKVRRGSVYLAWSFTVASDRSLTARLLRIRDDAFRRLGDRRLGDRVIQGRPPAYTITGVQNFTPAQDPLIARRVTGTVEVPCYLNRKGCPPGARFHYSSRKPDALPTQMKGNVAQAPFQCNVPRAAFSKPSRIALYGHGLLGSHTQIEEINIQNMSAEHDFTFCATDWAGMASEDVPNAIEILRDISKFPSLADRLQQGIVNTLYLGRLLAHPQGLAADAAFETAGDASVLDTSELYFDSNSQGAILGGLATAVAPDWRRAVLGVATMNYGTLLPRSVDFDTYNVIFKPAYPDGGTRRLIISLIQMLWDRGETNGWAYHVTGDPPPNTPRHTVLLHVAVGDHQVANVMSDVEARTIGARAYRPAVDAGRSTDRKPLYGIPSIKGFPFKGSAIVYWDGGPQTPLPPVLNLPNRGGLDPHAFPRNTVAARAQKSAFLAPGGAVIDVCGGRPCRTDNYGG
ncbi:MAG: hypothetical protein JW895_13915 [Thermoleophilaceae bacterium]|nr:hypothetical protein [Thermoleophilaceae bacterium]